MSFEAFAVSTGVVALGEMGDKTQLLALMLAARWRRPLPIIAGILVATLANHAMASALGTWLTRVVSPEAMRWGLGLSFIAVALWLLVPDKHDEGDERALGRFGVFGLTTVAFFLVEMGDKTQGATEALAARFQSVAIVAAGTTVGMLLANGPAVLFGDIRARKIPVRWVHRIAAVAFASIGVAVLMGLQV